MKAASGQRKIIVRQTNWLGDVMMALPFLAALRQKEPESHIAVLARPRVAAILQHQPGIDQFIVCDDEGLHRGMAMFQLASDLRNQKFDAAYLLPNSFSSALMMFLAAIPERIGFATDLRKPLLTRAIRKTAKLRAMHETVLYLRLLDIDYGIAGAVRPELPLLDEERQAAKQRIEAMGVKSVRPLVGLIPGAAYGTAKRWPAERFAALADRLAGNLGAEIILFGSAGERDVAERIESLSRAKIHNVAGQTRLRELAALLAECKVVVTNDTGAMHVAAAVGTPVVAVFGPTNPVTTSPVGPRHTLIRRPMDCSPCLLRHCPIDHRCMTAIDVEEVFEATCKRTTAPSQSI
jgi:heptosyltransferase-2